MISVVITVYNGASTLGVQLEALAAQEYAGPWEVVIVDNGSSDNSVEVANRFAGRLPNLRIVPEFKLRGRPFALNAGVRASRGKSILMTDQDDEVGRGWLAAMADALRHHDLVGCSVDHQKLNPPGLQWSLQETELPQLWFPPYLPYASGTSLGFRRAVYDRVQKFDETFAFVQDTDFCIRAQLAGFRLEFVPGAVLHYRRRTALKDHYRQARNYARESATLAKRYWPTTAKTAPVLKHFWREWITMARSVRKIKSRPQLLGLMWHLGRQVGRLQGMVFDRGIPV